MTLIRGLEEMLKSLDAIVKKYQGLARRERRIWNQLRLATEDLNGIRGKLAFHINAINAFTASLSRDTLAQIERVLLEVVDEVRQGRRPPSIASLDESENQSVWKELEAELAEDGIYKSDVARHKIAIRLFLQGRLGDSATDTMSLDEVASLVESSNEREDSNSLMQRLSAVNPSSTGLSRIPTASSIDKASLITADSEQYESAVEEIPGKTDLTASTTVPRVTFASFTRVPDVSRQVPEDVVGIDKRLQQLTYGKPTTPSIYRYRHSIDVSFLDVNAQEIQKGDKMVLIIDPYHSCGNPLVQRLAEAKMRVGVSKLAHAYMRSLLKTNNIVREQLDTVRSTGWMMQKQETNHVAIDALMKELLTSKRIEVPKWETYYLFKEFRFDDIIQFDHIIYINSPSVNSPSFRQYLEDNIQKIAALQTAQNMEDKKLARLCTYEFPSTIQIPESMSWRTSTVPEMFRNHQKLALDEVFGAVKRIILGFLEREYGLRRTSQGFEKITSRRPSRSSSLSLPDRRSQST